MMVGGVDADGDFLEDGTMRYNDRSVIIDAISSWVWEFVRNISAFAIVYYDVLMGQYLYLYGLPGCPFWEKAQ